MIRVKEKERVKMGRNKVKNASPKKRRENNNKNKT